MFDSEENKIENSENFLHYDFDGWPVTKKTLRELLLSLGAELTEGRISFDNSNPVLDIYPETLVDDGMGYGVEERFFTDINISKDKEGKEHIYFWRDKK